MDNKDKPNSYAKEYREWQEVLPELQIGQVYTLSPLYAEHLKVENEKIPNRPGFKKKYVGFFKIEAITGEGKYVADFDFVTMDGQPIWPNVGFIQLASNFYEQKDLDLISNLSNVGL